MPKLTDSELRERYGVRRKTPAERARVAAEPAAPTEADGAATGAPSRSVSLPRPSVPHPTGTPTRSVVTALLGAMVIFAIAGGQLGKRIASNG